MQLKHTNSKGRMKLLRVIPYHDCPIYIRMIGSDIFMYDLIIKNQLYSSYLVISPSKGKKRLTKKEIQEATMLINSGAQATIDAVLGIKLDKKVERVAKIIAGIN
jgi:hypothetical protein